INVGRCVLAVAVIVLFSQSGFCGTYGGGSGTAENPFLISTAEHLNEIGVDPNDWDEHFLLTADIDLGGEVYVTALIAPDTYNITTTFQGTPFSGVFDGNGHVIRNLTINSTGTSNNYLGLFGMIDDNAEVKNLGMENVSIVNGKSSIFVGGLAGYSSGTITNCFAVGSVDGSYKVGGLVGENFQGALVNCYSVVDVDGIFSVGGLVGNCNNGSVTNCYSAGIVNGDISSGGLAGYNSNGIYVGSFWDSQVNAGLTGIGSMADPAGVMGRTTGQMHSESTFVDAGWDFVGESVNGTDDFWLMTSSGYPVLAWQSIPVVPDITGLSQEEALSILELAGFWIEIKELQSTQPVGSVLSTYPEAGLQSLFVTIFISKGHPYAGGSGSESDPYLISTGEHMQAIGIHIDDWDKHFVLTADIDLSEYVGSLFNIIGNETTPFTGVFDGNGYIIQNLTIDLQIWKDFVGLFGKISGNNAQVKDLGLENVSVYNYSEFHGGLAGFNGGTIINCYVTGRIQGTMSVGGLVGYNHGSIIDCYASCRVKGNWFRAGGLVGSNSGGTISNCYANGNVMGEHEVGGLVGENREGSITDCYANCNVRGEDKVGGLVGYNWYKSTITRCSASGRVAGLIAIPRGNAGVGGLIGVTSDSCTITFCYATGSVSGRGIVGGLIGLNYSAVSNCYSSGDVSGSSQIGGFAGQNSSKSLINIYSSGRVTGDDLVGGFVGYHIYAEDCISCFWDSEINATLSGLSNIDDPEGVMGRTTSQMQSQSTFTGQGWDFVGESDNGSDDIWYMPGCGSPVLSTQTVGIVPEVVGLPQDDALLIIKSTIPVVYIETVHSYTVTCGNVISLNPPVGCESTVVTILVSTGFPYESGTGTQAYPYQIWTAQQLNAIGKYQGDWENHFVIMADIDLSEYIGESYNCIGDSTAAFTGVIDGNGHTISNLTFASSDRDGYTGLLSYVGPGAEVRNLILTDVNIDVPGGNNISGLAAYTEGSIIDCAVYGEVTGHYRVGILAGENKGSILNSYAIGKSTGYASVGGFVGSSEDGSLTKCYSSGDVSGYDYVGGFAGSVHYCATRDCYSTCSVEGNRYIGGFSGVSLSSKGIINCYATGNVIAIDDYAGGFTGDNRYGLESCYATGSVSGDEFVGGFAGANDDEIVNCYCQGSTSGRSHIGGFVGSNEEETISRCYTVSKVNGSASRYTGAFAGGGIDGDIKSCFVNTDINPDVRACGSYTPGGSGAYIQIREKTTSEMQTMATYTTHYWDFVGENTIGTDDVWRMCLDGVGYPALSWESDLVGDFACPDGVGVEDLCFLGERWLGGDGRADLNGDGVVDLGDYALFAEFWVE
ncbi:MAG: PASTA domain-containing protein, partial [Anaerohalosphaera sp.]|nr:PASTA domain-containing protein [Anaerohalosphaera sp.]